MGHVRQRPRTVKTPRTRTKSSKQTGAHTHPTDLLPPLSLSLPLLSPSLVLAQVVAQSRRRSAPTRAEARERARLPPQLRSALLFSAAFCLRRLLRARGKQLAEPCARSRSGDGFSLVLIFGRGIFFLIRVCGGVRRSDWWLRAVGGVDRGDAEAGAAPGAVQLEASARPWRRR